MLRRAPINSCLPSCMVDPLLGVTEGQGLIINFPVQLLNVWITTFDSCTVDVLSTHYLKVVF